MKYNRPEWPETTKFAYGDRVQRSPMGNQPPAYRFRGRIVGWYVSNGGVGYVVALDHDPGCKQIFPEKMLEPWVGDAGRLSDSAPEMLEFLQIIAGTPHGGLIEQNDVRANQWSQMILGARTILKRWAFPFNG